MNKLADTVNNRKYIEDAEVFLKDGLVKQALNCYEKFLQANPNFIQDYIIYISQVSYTANGNEQAYKEYIGLYPQIVQNAAPFVERKTSVSNIYHCSIPKAATQWLMSIFCDSRIHKYSGLLPFVPRINLYNNVPANSIITGTFSLPYEKFKIIRESGRGKSKAFFVMRDPRDVLVSAYFSHKYSHKADNHIKETREILNKLSKEEGLIYNIELFTGVFDILRSWKDASIKNEDFLLIKYEDLIGTNSLAVFKNLFKYCEIEIPESVLADVLEDYSFNSLSRGRSKGSEDNKSHYRKGVHGDWKNHFNAKIRDKFEAVAGDLVTHLGYKWDGEGDLGKEYQPKGLKTYDFIGQNLQLGDKHYRENDLDKAAEYYNNIFAELKQPLATSLFFLGLICFRKTELKQAQDLFFKVITIDDRLADAYYYLGKINLDLDEYSTSIKYFKQYKSQRPDNVDTDFFIGLAYFKSGDLKSSLSAFNKVAKSKPNTADTYFYIGEIYMKQQNIQEGIKYHDIYQSMIKNQNDRQSA